jgi:protein-disulfide isomerase
MVEELTKKQRRDQKKAFIEAQRQNRTKNTNMKKYIVAGVIIVGIIVLFWFIQKSMSGPDGQPNQGVTEDPRKGGENALVVIREYADFQCPACQTMVPYLQQAIEEFGEDVAVEFNDFPLPANVHRFAFLTAEAGQCANVQGKFWEYHDTLYAEQAVWSANTSETAVQDLLVGYAKDLGMNTADFEQCLDDHEQRSLVQEDVNEGDAVKVQSTPTLFINEERYAGVSTYKSIKDAIQKELDKANKASEADAEVNTDATNSEVTE